MAYDANLGGVADRMQDQAQLGAGRSLFTVGELLEHIHRLDSDGECPAALIALGCQVAFAWMLDEQVV